MKKIFAGIVLASISLFATSQSLFLYLQHRNPLGPN